MHRPLHLHVLRAGAALRPHEWGATFEFEAFTLDGLLARACDEFVRRGYRVRAIWFTSSALVAYVEAAS